jgi:hypothetical protein
MRHVWRHRARLALLQDMQRPLYMRAADAIEYGVIDRMVPPQKASMMIDKVIIVDALCLLQTATPRFIGRKPFDVTWRHSPAHAVISLRDA